MDRNVNDRQDQGNQGEQRNQEMNRTHDNRYLKNESKANSDEWDVPGVEDPAAVNPEELASFPKQKDKGPLPIDHEKENAITKRSSVREGRNIARTENTPDENGYI